jgi:hypothetical protein
MKLDFSQQIFHKRKFMKGRQVGAESYGQKDGQGAGNDRFHNFTNAPKCQMNFE